MSIELTKETYAPYERKMERSLQVLHENLNAVRAGRANPRVLDRIQVNYYGSDTPLNQVANVQVPEARMITIQPWEPKMLSEIERAIQMSDLGINPTNDGKIIRLSFPMYYIDFITFMENPDKTWENILAKEQQKAPPEPTLFD